MKTKQNYLSEPDVSYALDGDKAPKTGCFLLSFVFLGFWVITGWVAVKLFEMF